MTDKRDWKTELIRFTLLGVKDLEAAGLWEKLVGTPPDSSTSRPAQKVLHESGTWNGVQFDVQAQPNRIDIVVTPAPNQFDQPPSLGDFIKYAEAFRAMLCAVRLPTAERLALGASLYVECGGLEQSLTSFEQLVPYVKDVGKANDLSFQINLQKKLPKLSGVVINRLYKWSQMVYQYFNVQLNDGAQSVPVQADVVHAVKLELDINTAPSSKLPASDSYPSFIEAIFLEATQTFSELR